MQNDAASFKGYFYGNMPHGIGWWKEPSEDALVVGEVDHGELGTSTTYDLESQQVYNWSREDQLIAKLQRDVYKDIENVDVAKGYQTITDLPCLAYYKINGA